MTQNVVYLKGENGKVATRLFSSKGKYLAYFPFDAQLKEDIKAMRGSRWDPDQKCWTFERCRRNDFQLAYLMGLNPYEHYDKEIPESKLTDYGRPLLPHQPPIVDFMLSRRRCIVAVEMGLGKTLAVIELMERIRLKGTPWWVGPKLTLTSIEIELERWNSTITPELMTYHSMGVATGENVSVPNVVIFDESSKVKTAGVQRSRAARKLSERVIEKWGDDAYIILLSGRPAPNAPIDWWSQAEIACPGFLREGKIESFEQRLCLKEKVQKMDGGYYPKFITWWNDMEKCATCGITKKKHGKEIDHTWRPSVNEVERLEKRLKGLTYKLFKKDCIVLPPKQYLKVKVAPNPRAMILAKQIRERSTTTGEMMYRLRALSDGYLVEDVPNGKFKACSACEGSGVVSDIDKDVTCHVCEGEGKSEGTERLFKPIMSPKPKALEQILENYSDLGRLVVWAPLHGTLELLRNLAAKNGWNVLRMDGKMVAFENHKDIENPPETQKEMLEYFQAGGSDPCVFIGNPEAAGMGLTLHAADAMVFYSNSYKPEARAQGEDRIDRIGSSGCRVIDIVCMPIDEVIREALMNKEKLQDMSLGKVQQLLIREEEKWDV